jgi:hypothetical protein
MNLFAKERLSATATSPPINASAEAKEIHATAVAMAFEGGIGFTVATCAEDAGEDWIDNYFAAHS